MKILATVLTFVVFGLLLLLVVPPIIRSIDLNVECAGFLSRAANANTVELASEQLDKAIENIEERKWTEGSSRVVFDYPECDIGYWYKNLCAANAELKEMAADASQLEKSNMLMKLRETLAEQGKEGDNLIIPPNINYYPNQFAWVIWWWAGSLVCIVLAILCIAAWGSCDW